MALLFANNNSLSAITSLPASISGGGMTLIQTQTASSSSTISFTSGIDSTYDEYVFKFINIHASANSYFQVNFRDGGTNYDATKTTTIFYASHKEDGSETGFAYNSGSDLANSTGIQRLTSGEIFTNNDCSLSGYLNLFNPSSTTFVKHFIAQTQYMTDAPASENSYIAGYCNVTAAIDGVQFNMSSGTFDGVIKLYGIS